MQEPTKITVSEVIDIMLNYEKAAHEFYKAMAEGFSYIPIISSFWRKMMLGESEHVAEVMHVKSSLESDKKSMQVDVALAEKMNRLYEIASMDLVSSICNLQDAYEVACALENCELDDVFSNLYQKKVLTKEGRLILKSGLLDHQTELSIFGSKYGGSQHGEQYRFQPI